MKRVVQKYNQLFETNITYLSDKQTLQLVEKLELKESFPFKEFSWGKKLKDQPKEIQVFFDAHVTDIELTPEEAIPSMIERIFKVNVKNKKFSWRDITLNDIYTALSVTAAEDSAWLFNGWDKESVNLFRQSEEMQKQVQEHLEKIDIGDDNVQEANERSNKIGETE